MGLFWILFNKFDNLFKMLVKSSCESSCDLQSFDFPKSFALSLNFHSHLLPSVCWRNCRKFSAFFSHVIDIWFLFQSTVCPWYSWLISTFFSENLSDSCYIDFNTLDKFLSISAYFSMSKISHSYVLSWIFFHSFTFFYEVFSHSYRTIAIILKVAFAISNTITK